MHEAQFAKALRDTAEALDDTRHVLHRDYETRSPRMLKSVGAHRYAADPETEVLCCAYAVGDDPVQLWIPGNRVPPEFTEAAGNPSWLVVAHNDSFRALAVSAAL
jgi:DNA polymerase bacteriophage-type